MRNTGNSAATVAFCFKLSVLVTLIAVQEARGSCADVADEGKTVDNRVGEARRGDEGKNLNLWLAHDWSTPASPDLPVGPCALEESVTLNVNQCPTRQVC
jgi:hypothetical protein